MANDLTMTKETIDEVITVTLDKKLVTKFDKAYSTAGKSMKDMCMLAYAICGEDADAKALFNKHVINDLGMTKGTASKLITTGGIYTNYPDTQIMSHTKTFELLPVRDEVTEFLNSVDMSVVELNELTQATIREKVKKYLNPTETAQETTGEVVESTQDVTEEVTETASEDTTPTVDPRDAKIEELEKANSYLTALVATAHAVLANIDENYEFEGDDAKAFKAVLKELGQATKKGGNK